MKLLYITWCVNCSNKKGHKARTDLVCQWCGAFENISMPILKFEKRWFLHRVQLIKRRVWQLIEKVKGNSVWSIFSPSASSSESSSRQKWLLLLFSRNVAFKIKSRFCHEKTTNYPFGAVAAKFQLLRDSLHSKSPPWSVLYRRHSFQLVWNLCLNLWNLTKYQNSRNCGKLNYKKTYLAFSVSSWSPGVKVRCISRVVSSSLSAEHCCCCLTLLLTFENSRLFIQSSLEKAVLKIATSSTVGS